MIIAVDFDGTVVEAMPYAGMVDPSQMRLRPGAKRALTALRVAGHLLVLSSVRSNQANRSDWRLNPLWASGQVAIDVELWAQRREWWEATHQAMLVFVEQQLPGVFNAVDEGVQGKPLADLYLDDLGYRMGPRGWGEVEMLYGPAGNEARGQG